MTSRSCIYFWRFEAGWPSVSLLVVDSMDCVGWVVSENLTGERAYDFLFGRAISALFAAADQGIGLNAHFFVRASVFFVARFTLSQPSTPLRNATNLRTFCFGLSSCLSRDFCQNQRVLCSIIWSSHWNPLTTLPSLLKTQLINGFCLIQYQNYYKSNQLHGIHLLVVMH